MHDPTRLARQQQLDAEAERLARRYPDALVPKPSLFQTRLAWVVGVTLLAIAGIQAAGPDALGIPSVVFRWLGVIAFIGTGLQAALPPVKRIMQGGK